MSATKKEKRRAKRKASENTTSPEPKKIKLRTVVTPWRDTSEYTNVYNWLFAKTSDADSHRQALSRIRIWQYRRGSLCPAGVLATAVLIEAQLEDREGNDHIQSLYANAFTRFFNFMSSIIKGHTMASMYETAKELGLASFVVDLRHLCAHGQELPPVNLLRRTTSHCVEWLRKYYWLPFKQNMTNLQAEKLLSIEVRKFTKEMTKVVELYDLALECYLLKAHKLKAISKLKTSGEFNRLRIYCSKKKVKSTMEILSSLVTDIAGMLKKEATSKKDFFQIFLDNLLHTKVFLTAGLKFKEDEELIIEATQNTFRMLATEGYINNLFVALIELVENNNESEERRSGASYWALKMINTFKMLNGMKKMYKEELDQNDKFKPTNFSSLNKAVPSKTMKTLLIHSGMDLPLTLVFGDPAKKPSSWVFSRDFVLERVSPVSEYSVEILKGLLSLVEPPLSSTQLKDLTRLCNIRFHLLPEEEYETELEVRPHFDYSLQDLENIMAGNDNYVPLPGTTFGLWTLETDKNWEKCALGVLPY